ncbi:MAG: radical SAM family heme chaperone HemW [Candidatus Latescibacteria bacterium]|nr:radical SAM family heme chaperone HemW [Candidatus Latescibacterota bacterium]
MEYGLYIHLPYCRSICPYCDFVKAPLHRAEPARLLAALERERTLVVAAEGAGTGSVWSRPRTIYVGGGTPTALDAGSLRRFLDWIRSGWDRSRVREFTVEANPEGLSDEKLEILREAGVDRLSLGVQSLEPAVLRFLGRIHTAEGALSALDRARRTGFRTISADLMYGVPGETPEGFWVALQRLVALGVPHLSAYPLQIEEGTPLHAKVRRGELRPEDEDAVAERYGDLVEILSRAGYRHYEVSNFALPGSESRHNEGYWLRRPYLGLGPGAHSFDGSARWRNEESIARYFERVESGALPREERIALTDRESAEERVFLALRRSRGLRVGSHLKAFRPTDVASWRRWALAGGAVAESRAGRVRPTDRGLLLAHDLAAELFARADTGPMRGADAG